MPPHSRSICCVCLGLSLLAADARAQARTEVQPSLTAGLVFDDNIFYSADRTADLIWKVTPALVVRRETPFGSFEGRYGFDAEHYRTQTDLTSLFARQDAGISVTARPAPSVRASFNAGVDSTLRPAELNLSTRLATGRRRAWRIYGAPEVEAEIVPRVTLIGRYDALLDILRPREARATLSPPIASPPVTPPSSPLTPAPAAPAATLPDDLFDLLPPEGLTLFSHEVEFRTEYEVTERQQFRSAYRLQQFRSEGDPFITVHVPTAGYARRFGPSTRLTVDAGPRFVLGTIDLEAEATLAHTYRRVQWTTTYARTLASSIGIAEIVKVDRVLAGVRYINPGETELDLTVGYFRSTPEAIGSEPLPLPVSPSATVYQATASVMQRLRGPVSVVAGLSWDLQRGRLGGGPLDAAGVPLLSDRLHRQVAFVQLRLAPRIRPLPRDEDEEPTGRARPGDRSKR